MITITLSFIEFMATVYFKSLHFPKEMLTFETEIHWTGPSSIDFFLGRQSKKRLSISDPLHLFYGTVSCWLNSSNVKGKNDKNSSTPIFIDTTTPITTLLKYLQHNNNLGPAKQLLFRQSLIESSHEYNSRVTTITRKTQKRWLNLLYNEFGHYITSFIVISVI